MKQTIYRRSPSVLAYMLRALLPSSGLRKLGGVPPQEIRLQGFTLSKASCEELFRLSDLPPARDLPIFFPHVLSFRLVMRAVTDPSFPEPIWRALQVRNSFVQYAPLSEGDTVDIRLETAGVRFLEKGAEADFLMTLSKGGGKTWEGVTTFYYRGSFGRPGSSPSRPPEFSFEPCTAFSLQKGGGFLYGRLSGDFNGIHLWNPYARLLGFRSAFFHPHRVVGAALARMPR